MNPNLIATAVVAWLAGIAASFLYYKWTSRKRSELLEIERTRMIEAAKSSAENDRDRWILQAKEQALERRAVVDEQIAAERRSAEQQLSGERKAAATRLETLDRRDDSLRMTERNLRKMQSALEAAQKRLQTESKGLAEQQQLAHEKLAESDRQLVLISGMTRDQAAAKVLADLEAELEHERGSILLRHHKRMTETSTAQGREILLTAIQRYASTHTSDSTTSTVDVPTDDMKGRIIGREGRNIRTFEKVTGVDVIIDDTPGVVIVSAFDPVRRETARRSLSKLIADGRIHPSKIEEVFEETSGEIDEVVMLRGREAADEVNVSGLDEKVIRQLGRLHFRTSFSQNVLRHSIEVAFVAGLVAEMLGMDAAIARRCGLLHDIGKAADHELEGGHPKIGADLLRRCGEPAEVVHAAAGHHDEIVVEHPYTMLTAIGDACSASRPGARRESLERYVKRMEELESIAKRFDGVRQAFAISAGRELRVIVSSQKTSDEEAAVVCREIAKAFESELTYPGEIKVTVLRESRFTETAH